MERFIRAWRVIFLAGRFDLVFLQRTTFPLGMERLAWLRNRNIVFDIDDSIYLPDKKEGGIIGWMKRRIKKKEVVSILRVSKCVIAENNYIKDFVSRYCRDVRIITGPIDTGRNYPKDNINRRSQDFIIGWIGSPSTTLYLSMLDTVFKQLNRKYNIRVRLIGASRYHIDGVKVELADWSEETEVSELHKFDIGVMSMPDNEWTRGKVGCKMLQYMANAVPAVVSYTPTTAEVIEDGVNGFMAASEEEWFRKISLLIEDPSLREKIGMAGRKTAEERFSMEAAIPKYLEIFRSCF
jgi:glycosyltransferase involved in cell wall biosynthesis